MKAIVTGGSKGIGRETARILAEEGCDVADHRARRRAARAGGRGDRRRRPDGRSSRFAGDMSVQADVERTMGAAIEALGGVDILVTCAGSSPGGLLEGLTEDQWMSSVGLKFMGYVRCLQRRSFRTCGSAGSGSVVLVVGNDGIKSSYWELTAGIANAADINVASALAEQYGRYRRAGQHGEPRAGEHRSLGRAREAVRARPRHPAGRGAPDRPRDAAARDGSASRRRSRASWRSSPPRGRATCRERTS